MKIIFGVVILTLLQACATSPSQQRMTQTASGSPEVVITNATQEKIRLTIINAFLNDGWQISSDYGVNFSLTQRMAASEAAGKRFAASLLDGKKGGEYTDEIAFSMISSSNQVRVIARFYTISQYPGGQTTRTLNEDVDSYNEIQQFLVSVRDVVSN